ncbi:hypothetical protein MFIFM68171_09957 [Madurella fahalii]|uniref:Uncharacterized protein n=1 Tax=Madurella fahalii TaxID=1157608 RepID=A0ABQ0GPS9_9PEZI
MPGAAFEVTAPLPNGATFQASETETQSIGITASVSLGGSLFEVMTAEIGLSVSAQYSISSSTTVSFVPLDTEVSRSDFDYRCIG